MDEIVGDYQFNRKDLIGHGAFAVVFKGRHSQRTDLPVAIKSITKKSLAKSQALLEKEIKILEELTKLQHENVVCLLDCKETSQYVYIVMEYCNGGDLADYLMQHGTLSEDTIRLFTRQICEAMKALQSKGIIHRDLKPQNILLCHNENIANPSSNDITLKIADFGFARFLQDGVMAATLCGSPQFMAVEILLSKPYDCKADLWSIGTILYQCLTGKAPFQAQSPQALRNYYEKTLNLKPKLPPDTSAELSHLLINLLKREPRDRISFEDFYEHPFLKPPKTQPMSVPQRQPLLAATAASSSPSANTTNPLAHRNSPCANNNKLDASPPVPIGGTRNNENLSSKQRNHNHHHRQARHQQQQQQNSGCDDDRENVKPSSSQQSNKQLRNASGLQQQQQQQAHRQRLNSRTSLNNQDQSRESFGSSAAMNVSPITQSPMSYAGNGLGSPMSLGNYIYQHKQQHYGQLQQQHHIHYNQQCNSHDTYQQQQPTMGAAHAYVGSYESARNSNRYNRRGYGGGSNQPLLTNTPVDDAAIFSDSSDSSDTAVGNDFVMVSTSEAFQAAKELGGNSTAQQSGGSPASSTGSGASGAKASLSSPRSAQRGCSGSPFSARSSAGCSSTSPGSRQTTNNDNQQQRHKFQDITFGISNQQNQHQLQQQQQQQQQAHSSDKQTRQPNFNQTITDVSSIEPPTLRFNFGSPPGSTLSLLSAHAIGGSGSLSSGSGIIQADTRSLVPYLTTPGSRNSITSQGMTIAGQQSPLTFHNYNHQFASQNAAAASNAAAAAAAIAAQQHPHNRSTPPILSSQQSGQNAAAANATFNNSSTSGSLLKYVATHFQSSPLIDNSPPVFYALDLPEETLLDKEHNETLAKLNFIDSLVGAILSLADSRSALINLTDDNTKPEHLRDLPAELVRKVERLVLYLKALHMTSSSLQLSRTEIKANRLRNSSSVRQVLRQLKDKFHHCLNMCKALDYQTTLSSAIGKVALEYITPDRIIYEYAIEMCQTAALEEMFGHPEECFKRYHTAQILLHGLLHQVSQDDKQLLEKYKVAVEKRLLMIHYHYQQQHQMLLQQQQQQQQHQQHQHQAQQQQQSPQQIQSM